MTQIKVVGYETGKAHTNEIVKAMLHSVQGEFLSIAEFNEMGLARADLVVISGILRGPGLVFKACQQAKQDFLFIDHAYFLKGYGHPTWMRITKNRHVGPTSTGHTSERFDKYFSQYKFLPWQGNKDGHVLLLPPTNAMEWLCDAQNWVEDSIAQIKKYTNKKIIVRAKPDNPHVDHLGNLVRMESYKPPIPLTEEIKGAYAVIAYNSNAASEATQMGVPVICAEHCPIYPITYKFSDLTTGEAFVKEPPRQQLFYDLAHGQYTIEEMRNGAPLQDCIFSKGTSS